MTVPVHDFDREIRFADTRPFDNTNWWPDLSEDEEPHCREAFAGRWLVHDLTAAPDQARCAHVWPSDLTEAQCLHCHVEYESWTADPVT
ncbi:hypothetical protein [Actinoplanes palleronii]|uniref:Uncharacterized protein n=1 Tax=Actinoplanes palleronii TaxID=113570 RepID=A0ABQ4B9Z0_9ACTN|nr:hypothetical protein [Actinoplanes palleronii]GIE67458.1 hypothetical protein Apa02nite_035660 [Actinoplanes palleronii]